MMAAAAEEQLTTATPVAFESYIVLGGRDPYVPLVDDDPYRRYHELRTLVPPEEISRYLETEEAAAMSLTNFELTGADADRFTPPGARQPAAHLSLFTSRLERLAFASTRAPPPPPPPFSATHHAVGDGGFGVFLIGGARRVDAATATPADTSCLGKSKYEEPRGGDDTRSGADSTGCVICIQEFEVGDDLSTIPCAHRHRFHVKCLAEWFKRSRSCPLCRHLLPGVPANSPNVQVL